MTAFSRGGNGLRYSTHLEERRVREADASRRRLRRREELAGVTCFDIGRWASAVDRLGRVLDECAAPHEVGAFMAARGLLVTRVRAARRSGRNVCLFRQAPE